MVNQQSHNLIEQADTMVREQLDRVQEERNLLKLQNDQYR